MAQTWLHATVTGNLLIKPCKMSQASSYWTELYDLLHYDLYLVKPVWSIFDPIPETLRIASLHSI